MSEQKKVIDNYDSRAQEEMKLKLHEEIRGSSGRFAMGEGGLCSWPGR